MNSSFRNLKSSTFPEARLHLRSQISECPSLFLRSQKFRVLFLSHKFLWQPTRVPRPWDSPGKNIGVGCHFLLQCMKVKSESEVAQSLATSWTAAYQASLSMGFSRQEYWSGLPLPSLRNHFMFKLNLTMHSS